LAAKVCRVLENAKLCDKTSLGIIGTDKNNVIRCFVCRYNDIFVMIRRKHLARALAQNCRL
jgi:hypothetical protein